MTQYPMPVHQLSLWDNEALETGYRCLNALEWEAAIRQFNKALQGGIGEIGSVQKLIAASHYWKERIQHAPGPETHSDATASFSQHIAGLLADYSRYSFTPQMAGFKKALLGHIVDLLHHETDMDLNDMETAFDLLLGMDDFQTAEDLISHGIKKHPKKRLLLYFLAQAQWLNDNRSDANNNYVRLLFYHPDKIMDNRIENKKLKELIHSCGPAMAPAYGWVRNVLPFVPPADEIPACDEEHHKAIKCYRLLWEANRSMNNNDMQSCIQYRKQLKELTPALYDEYFNLLKQRK